MELNEGLAPAPHGSGSVLTPDGRRMLETIDRLLEEREVFGPVRIQGPTRGEAAGVSGPSEASGGTSWNHLPARRGPPRYPD
jgi:RNA polymerase sigma-70 factor (ECF subfamily)